MASRPEYVFTRDFLDNNRIWLFDVAETVSKSTRLVGLDISFKAAPPPATLPSNVTLRHWDVRDDVPEDLINAFDIVHLRFFSFVVMNEEVPGVVEKLYKLLRPGGYLQWGDPDVSSIRIDKSEPGNKTESLSRLMQLMTVQDPRFSPKWVTELPNIFEASGFVDIERHVCDAPPHLSFIMHECGLMIHDLIARKTKNEKMAQELEQLLPQAVEDTREGAYVSAVRWVVIGRKPEETSSP
ncbi:hypothetical protein DL771_001587 [Monosporascus sp. 5C6A]|nr:hypothetical protein DL771_001587 [Monosporascus sp. 5C6A]